MGSIDSDAHVVECEATFDYSGSLSLKSTDLWSFNPKNLITQF